MGRLKGLDEMPETTGLEIDWSEILPGTTSGRGSRRGRRSGSGVATVVSIVLTATVVAGGGYLFSQGLLPTRSQIRAEVDRQVTTMTAARNSSETLDSATRPGLDGVEPDASSTNAQKKAFYRDRMGTPFPAGTSNPLLPVGADGVVVRFMDTTGNGLSKTIRIRDLSANQTWVTAYVAADSEARVTLPPGGYRVSIAEGETWYGDADQFRDEGRYYEPQTLDVRSGQSLMIELPAAGTGDAQDLTDQKDF